MHRFITALAFILLVSGCRERSGIDTPPKAVELPAMKIHADSEENPMLIATVSNPSGSELSIPGSDGDLIYGSYWYQGDKVIGAPDCGTGYWDSVIKIPAGQTRQLRLPVPRTVARGDRYTVAVVYGGLGSSTDKDDRRDMSTEEYFRHPDIMLQCRKMESEITLPK